MEQSDRVLMITFINGLSVPVEGSFSNFGDRIMGTTFAFFIHVTLMEKIGINLTQVMQVVEFDRKNVPIGQNKLVVPVGVKLN